jgi:hypothetical protein
MTIAGPDRTFGNRGTTWTGVAEQHNNDRLAEAETHYVGGTTVGLHVLSTGAPCLVVWGWRYAELWETSETLVRLVRFPVDGTPQESLRFDGTRNFDLSEAGFPSDPLASCTTATGEIAVLIRQGPPGGMPPGGGPPIYAYSLATIDARVEIPSVRRQSVDAGLLYDPAAAPRPQAVRMARDGTDLWVASSRNGRIRVAKIATGSHPFDVDLSGTPVLPGLIRVEVASVRVVAGVASIGLTAYLNHPGVGATSLGAVLRLRADGSRDSSFADNGLWVSPIGVGSRGFVCAAEQDGYVAGAVDRRAVVFAPDPFDTSGEGLDGTFAGGGMAERDLGGPLSDPVAVADANGIYVFAQRVPTRASTAGADLRTVGTRFRLAPGTVDHGTPDPTWANAGTMTVRCDAAPVAASGLVLAGSQLFIGGTRQLRGADLDRVPIVVAASAATGDPVPGFGNGGVALHGSVTFPALVDPNGSAVFVERSTGAVGRALRLANDAGEVGPLVPLNLVRADSDIVSLTRLPSGGLLIGGGGADAWVAKLDAGGAPDTSFGTGGVATPRSGAGQGIARVLGLRSNGDIALRVSVAGSDELALMHQDGSIDTTYGTNGFVGVETFTHFGAGPTGASAFLQDDGSVILAISNSHEPTKGTFVRVALRRVTDVGAYDPAFGLGSLSVNPPTAGQSRVLISPSGGTSGDDEYSAISPAGIATMGGSFYLVATGWVGGRHIVSGGLDVQLPRYPLLVVLRWNADGTLDSAFADNGLQEAGFTPDRLYWGAAGLLADSPTSLYVYGVAGQAEQVTHQVAGGQPYTVTLVRQPQPALFRIEHPGGLDLGFDGDGAATVRLQEVLLSPVAGALVNGIPRVACVDFLDQPSSNRPQTNLGVLIQWAMRRRRPLRPSGGPFPRPIIPPQPGPPAGPAGPPAGPGRVTGPLAGRRIRRRTGPP